MAEAQQVVSGHEMGGSSTGKSAQIRDLEVRAIWDGLPEHPVNVRIQCTVSALAKKAMQSDRADY